MPVLSYVQPFRFTNQDGQPVTDKNLLSPVVGAYVKIDNDSTKVTMTDKNGAYEFKNIPVGRHKITATHIRYAEITIPKVIAFFFFLLLLLL